MKLRDHDERPRSRNLVRVGFKLAHLWSLALYGNTQAVAPDEALVRVAGVSCERRRLWVWPSHVGEDRGLPPARGGGDVGDAGGATHVLFASKEGLFATRKSKSSESFYF